MTAMSTVLTFSGSNRDTIMYALANHTAQVPSMVAVTRKAGNGPTGNIESSFEIIKGTLDPDGVLVASRVVGELRMKYPKHGDFTEVTSAIAIMVDVVGSDEFLELVQKQLPPAI